VRDDSDHSIPSAQGFDRVGDRIERRLVERTESFVEEDGLQFCRAFGGQLSEL
jgi:hypothetical protein